MAAKPRKYRLLMYARMLDHWRSRVIAIGLAVLMLAAIGVFVFPVEQSWRVISLGGLGAFIFFFAFLLYVLRGAAYVQVNPKNLLIAAPFFRMRVGYSRIKRSMPTEMGALYLERKISALQEDLVMPVAGRTAILLELSAYPISKNLIRLFFSPLFAPLEMPHLVLLVDDWMKLSMELESARSLRKGMRRPGADGGHPSSGLLDSLRKK